ncbi:MAG: hypothetical protein A2987_07360 [Omnitrophica bacterium RIFCSPLOWO2_01_FULL_45_10]|nr:MAG: hypothetical protein A2987_07360 [Omnitrophica bacterium RIFCSPLOWO2_01_FULL_45_10]
MKNLGIIILLLISIIGASVLLISVKGTAAEGPGSDYGIYRKLDEILKNQKVIMETLASLKEEVEIIKIRVTR